MPPCAIDHRRDDALSLLRGVLFFADVVAVQRVLGDHELISREVELTVKGWLADNYDLMADAARRLPDVVQHTSSEVDVLYEDVEHLLKDLARGCRSAESQWKCSASRTPHSRNASPYLGSHLAAAAAVAFVVLGAVGDGPVSVNDQRTRTGDA